MSSPDSTPEERRARYHQLLGTIDKQTGHGQPVMIEGGPLWSVINHTPIDHTDALRALHAAVENGDVRRWTDAAGDWRYGLTESGIAQLEHVDAPTYTEEDVSRLRAVAETEAGREEPDGDVIAWANRRIQAVEL